MIYIALLRGINVGGKNKIKMDTLKDSFESVGMKSVKTYINSGNVVFKNDELSPALITQILEQTISDKFDLNIRVLLRSIEDFKHVIEAIPETWVNNQHMKSDVLFLWNEIDKASTLEEIAIKPEIDTVKYVKGALLWSVEKKKVSKSSLSNLVGTKLYQKMTIRNVNTTRKLYLLMKQIEDET